jgi:hypothetical protein
MPVQHGTDGRKQLVKLAMQQRLGARFLPLFPSRVIAMVSSSSRAERLPADPGTHPRASMRCPASTSEAAASASLVMFSPD